MAVTEAGAAGSKETARAGGSSTGSRGSRRALLLCLAAAVLFLAGCDPLTVHKVTSTIFDGVPSMPPAEQYCKDYHERALQEERDAELKRRLAMRGAAASSHPPYRDKRCGNCHDKNTDSGFVTPADELCAHCHKNFPQGEYLHGPAAVGACLKCHVPHSSQNPSLLVKPKAELCSVCHVEPRVAEAMHTKVISNGMYCVDCHDPHGGGNRFFLR